MKYCPKCEEHKEKSEFTKNKSRYDGLNGWCRVCLKNWRVENRAELLVKKKEYYELTREARLVSGKIYRDNNKEKRAAADKNWRDNNKEKKRLLDKNWKANNRARCNANEAKRRAAKMQRTPAWLTKEDYSVMRAYYRVAQKLTEVTGEVYHVDHIIPLRGELVSGLHVPSNLQVLKGCDNSSKRNFFDLEEFNNA